MKLKTIHSSQKYATNDFILTSGVYLSETLQLVVYLLSKLQKDTVSHQLVKLVKHVAAKELSMYPENLMEKQKKKKKE